MKNLENALLLKFNLIQRSCDPEHFHQITQYNWKRIYIPTLLLILNRGNIQDSCINYPNTRIHIHLACSKIIVRWCVADFHDVVLHFTQACSKKEAHWMRSELSCEIFKYLQNSPLFYCVTNYIIVESNSMSRKRKQYTQLYAYIGTNLSSIALTIVILR